LNPVPVAAVILAAGAASRMGSLKQLLPFAGGTLLGRAIDQALAAEFMPVIIVVGSQADAVRAAISSMPVEIVTNDAWQTGMGSSVAAGVNHLPPNVGVALLTGDQPLVTAYHLQSMRQMLQTSDADVAVVAAEYSGTVGVPAIFKPHLQPRLRHLPPAAGAKTLLQGGVFRVLRFPLPEAATDVDTPEDWLRLGNASV
jgi:molybdenum cofactor cytidylyltransferase